MTWAVAVCPTLSWPCEGEIVSPRFALACHVRDVTPVFLIESVALDPCELALQLSAS